MQTYSTIKGGNKLFKKLNKSLNFPESVEIKAGFLGNDFYPDGTPVAKVAYWNDGGTPNIPERPFLTSAKIINKDTWVKMIKIKLKNSDSNFNKIGTDMVKKLKTNIVEWKIPGNAVSTINKKGFDDPLIDTKLMLNSVNYSISYGY